MENFINYKKSQDLHDKRKNKFLEDKEQYTGRSGGSGKDLKNNHNLSQIE